MRFQAACAAMQGILAGPESDMIPLSTLIESAVEHGDALISALQSAEDIPEEYVDYCNNGGELTQDSWQKKFDLHQRLLNAPQTNWDSQEFQDRVSRLESDLKL